MPSDTPFYSSAFTRGIFGRGKTGNPKKGGDLIVVKENGTFALYLYLKDRKVKADGEKRILHNKSKAYAKVLGSFNFYH